MAKEIGFRFKQVFCDVLDVIILEHGSKQGRHMKILVELDLKRPLLRVTKLKCDNKAVWVNFKYENMALFWFYCGKVRHAEKYCFVRKTDAICGRLADGQYGEWIRAEMNKGGFKQGKRVEKELLPVGGEQGTSRRGVRTEEDRSVSELRSVSKVAELEGQRVNHTVL